MLTLVLQSWELCRTGDFNLSYNSLTSRSARQALLDLRSTDPKFYSEITSGAHESIQEDAGYLEDETTGDTGDDGSTSSGSDGDFFESDEEISPNEMEDVDGDVLLGL